RARRRIDGRARGVRDRCDQGEADRARLYGTPQCASAIAGRVRELLPGAVGRAFRAVSIPMMSLHRRHLREKWYRDGWYSDRTCLDAFEAGAAEHADVPLTFVAGDSVRSLAV